MKKRRVCREQERGIARVSKIEGLSLILMNKNFDFFPLTQRETKKKKLNIYYVEMGSFPFWDKILRKNINNIFF